MKECFPSGRSLNEDLVRKHSLYIYFLASVSDRAIARELREETPATDAG